MQHAWTWDWPQAVGWHQGDTPSKLLCLLKLLVQSWIPQSANGADVPTEGLLGACTCKWPFFGEACEQVHCPMPRRQHIGNRHHEWFHGSDYIECSGHGKCHHQTGYAAQVWLHRHNSYLSHWCVTATAQQTWIQLGFDTNHHSSAQQQVCVQLRLVCYGEHGVS